VSFGEPIALRGQAEIEKVAALAATSGDARSLAETLFIERLRAGEAAAFETLVTDRSSEVYALLFRLTEDAEEARDLTQETFLRAFQSIAHFRGDANLRTWLYRIAINQARNRWRWWRRRRRAQTVSLDAPETNLQDEPRAAQLCETHASNPEQQTLLHERESILRNALRSLKRPYREVVILRDIEGLSYEEIAAALSIGIGTVKSRLSRGRIEIRRKLDNLL
jgi:RNA polymerase sigma-70 factor (ECF subfamily)